MSQPPSNLPVHNNLSSSPTSYTSTIPFDFSYSQMSSCCGSLFSSDLSLHMHLESALHFTGTSCPRCRIGYDSLEILAGHLLAVHSPLSRHPLGAISCARCGRQPPEQNHFLYDQGLHEFRCNQGNSDCANEVVLEDHGYDCPTEPCELEDDSETPPPRDFWLEVIRRLISPGLKSRHAPAKCDPVRLPGQPAARPSGYEASQRQQPQAGLSPRTTNPGLHIALPMRLPQHDSRLSNVTRSRQVPEQSTNARSPVHLTPARQLSTLTTSQIDRTSAADNWVTADSTEPARTRRSLAPSAVTNHVLAAHRSIDAPQLDRAPPSAQRLTTEPALDRPALLPISVTAPHRSVFEIRPPRQPAVRLSRQSVALATPSSAAVQQARRLDTSAALARAPRRSANIFLAVERPPARPSPETAIGQTIRPSVHSLTAAQRAPRAAALSTIRPAPRRSAHAPAPVQQGPARHAPHPAAPSTAGPVPPQAPPLALHPSNHAARQVPNPQREHPPPPTLRCDHCHRKFTSRHALNRHHSAVHMRNPIPDAVARARETPDAPRSTCMSCRKTFVNQYALDQHLVSNAHPENRGDGGPVCRCVECGLVFGTRDLLALHVVVHVRERMRRA